MQDPNTFLDSSFFQFFWEMPLLELLIYIQSKLQDEKSVNLLISFLGRPELNSTAANNAVFVENIKNEFIRRLSLEFFH